MASPTAVITLILKTTAATTAKLVTAAFKGLTSVINAMRPAVSSVGTLLGRMGTVMRTGLATATASTIASLRRFVTFMSSGFSSAVAAAVASFNRLSTAVAGLARIGRSTISSGFSALGSALLKIGTSVGGVTRALGAMGPVVSFTAKLIGTVLVAGVALATAGIVALIAIVGKLTVALVKIPFNIVSRGLGILGNAFGSLKSALAFAGIHLSIQGLVDDLASVITQMDTLGKFAKRLDLPVDQFSALAFGAKQAGITLDTLEITLRAFNRNIAKAAREGPESEAGKVFRRLGFDFKAAVENGTPLVELLREFADRLRDFGGTQQQQVEALNLLFGELGSKLIILLKDGSEGLDRFLKEANKVGAVFGPDLVQRFENAAEAARRFDSLLFAIKVTIADAVVPAITELINQMGAFVAAIPALARNLKSLVRDALGQTPLVFTEQTRRRMQQDAQDKLNTTFKAIIVTVKDIGFTLGTVLVESFLLAIELGFKKFAPRMNDVIDDFLNKVFGEDGGRLQSVFDFMKINVKLGSKGSVAGQLDKAKSQAAALQKEIKVLERNFGGTGSPQDTIIERRIGAVQAQLKAVNSAIPVLEAQARELETTRQREFQDQVAEATRFFQSGWEDAIKGVIKSLGGLADVLQDTFGFKSILSAFKPTPGTLPLTVGSARAPTTQPGVPFVQGRQDDPAHVLEAGTLRAFVEDFQNAIRARELAAVGLEEEAQTFKLLHDQAIELRKIGEDLGKFAGKTLTETKRIHALELDRVFVNTTLKGTIEQLTRLQDDYSRALETTFDDFAAGRITAKQFNKDQADATQSLALGTEQAQLVIQSLIQEYPNLRKEIEDTARAALQATQDAIDAERARAKNFQEGFKLGFDSLIVAAGDAARVGASAGNTIADGFLSVGDALVDGISKAKSFGDAFREMIAGVLIDLAKLILRMAISNAILSAFGGSPGGGIGSAIAAALGGGQQGFETGGLVSGQAGRDRVPARLTRGEFVVREPAVRRYGAAAIAAINSMVVPQSVLSRFSAGVPFSRGAFAEGGVATSAGGGDRVIGAAVSPTPENYERLLKGSGKTLFSFLGENRALARAALGI